MAPTNAASATYNRPKKTERNRIIVGELITGFELNRGTIFVHIYEIRNALSTNPAHDPDTAPAINPAEVSFRNLLRYVLCSFLYYRFPFVSLQT
jgi:hypothetical protein